MEEKKFEISEGLVNNIVACLQARPYKEVSALMGALGRELQSQLNGSDMPSVVMPKEEVVESQEATQ